MNQQNMIVPSYKQKSKEVKATPKLERNEIVTGT